MKKNTVLLVLSVVLALLSSCTRTANKTGPLTPYPEITADIDIGEQVRGEGTRAELLGFIRWGDPGRATFEARPQENALGGKVVKQSDTHDAATHDDDVGVFFHCEALGENMVLPEFDST